MTERERDMINRSRVQGQRRRRPFHRDCVVLQSLSSTEVETAACARPGNDWQIPWHGSEPSTTTDELPKTPPAMSAAIAIKRYDHRTINL